MPIPERINPESLADYLEVMTKAVFQAGTSWAMIDAKWDAFREAFGQFDPHKIACFKDKDFDKLMSDPRLFRSRKKMEGTAQNARMLLTLDKEFGGFKNYLRSFKTYDQLSKDIRKRFKYVGELSVYYFLFRVGEKVPPFEKWMKTVEGEHPRMREMVELARQKDPGAGR